MIPHGSCPAGEPRRGARRECARPSALAPGLPTYHYGQLAWSVLGARTAPLGSSLARLAGYAIVFLALALHAHRREERRKFL